MNNLCEFELHDRQLMAEIRLVADLMIAAGESAGPLDQATIDELLGEQPEVAVAPLAGELSG